MVVALAQGVVVLAFPARLSEGWRGLSPQGWGATATCGLRHLNWRCTKNPHGEPV